MATALLHLRTQRVVMIARHEPATCRHGERECGDDRRDMTEDSD